MAQTLPQKIVAQRLMANITNPEFEHLDLASAWTWDLGRESIWEKGVDVRCSVSEIELDNIGNELSSADPTLARLLLELIESWWLFDLTIGRAAFASDRLCFCYRKQ